MPAKARRLPVWGFVLLAAFYLVTITVTDKVFSASGSEYAKFNTTSAVLHNLYPLVIVGSVIGLVSVGLLRWWGPVMVEQERTPRWTLVFPILMLICVLGAINYKALGDLGLGFTLLLLGGTFLVGVSEETMFRGIGVVSFRQAGFSEGWVAIWTAALFGLGHSLNIIDNGLSQAPQVLITAFAGYFFYMVRRSTGFLVFAWLLHGLWDFGTFTGKLTDETYMGTAILIVADVVLAIIALATIRKVFPKRQDTVASPVES